MVHGASSTAWVSTAPSARIPPNSREIGSPWRIPCHTALADTAPTRTALVVVAHPRPDSLTAHIARLTTHRLTAAGYRIDLLDLNAENFDPRMTDADLPDWNNREKIYSPVVESHMRRILAADVIVAVFPVYWMQVPALLKGWIDRVWNYGFAYGRSKPRLRAGRCASSTIYRPRPGSRPEIGRRAQLLGDVSHSSARPPAPPAPEG